MRSIELLRRLERGRKIKISKEGSPPGPSVLQRRPVALVMPSLLGVFGNGRLRQNTLLLIARFLLFEESEQVSSGFTIVSHLI